MCLAALEHDLEHIQIKFASEKENWSKRKKCQMTTWKQKKTQQDNRFALMSLLILRISTEISTTLFKQASIISTSISALCFSIHQLSGDVGMEQGAALDTSNVLLKLG